MPGVTASYALGYLADYPAWPVRVEHQGEHRELMLVLEQAGFKVLRNHLAMRRKIGDH